MSGVQVQGLTPSGVNVALAATEDGKLMVSGFSGDSTSSGSGSSSNSGVIAGVDASEAQWLMIINSATTPPTITYINPVTGNAGTPTGGFFADSDQAEWEEASYTLDSSGRLTSETQRRIKSGPAVPIEVTRTRTWTYATDASGNVTATPGEWA